MTATTYTHLVHGKYRIRTWLRGRSPWSLAERIPKGEDCGAHEWYRQSIEFDACYHCRVTRPHEAMTAADELLEDLDWLADDVWVAHCIHPGEHGIELIARGGVCVAHCPSSNMLLGSGLAPTARFLEAGIRLGLGVDGSASNDGNNLKGEVKQAILSARVRDGASALSVRQALRMPPTSHTWPRHGDYPRPSAK